MIYRIPAVQYHGTVVLDIDPLQTELFCRQSLYLHKGPEINGDIVLPGHLRVWILVTLGLGLRNEYVSNLHSGTLDLNVRSGN
ncbi:MAG: hypothetical protein ACT6QS_05135 [Flavobacteriales bacterium]